MQRLGQSLPFGHGLAQAGADGVQTVNQRPVPQRRLTPGLDTRRRRAKGALQDLGPGAAHAVVGHRPCRPQETGGDEGAAGRGRLAGDGRAAGREQLGHLHVHAGGQHLL